MISAVIRNRAHQIFCQRCLAANSVEQELCGRCGTRLMLVVEPTTLRYEEDASSAGDFEEHLLERISTLENNLVRLTERLEQGMDLLLRHARTSYSDHVLLETLVSMLGENQTINRQQLEDVRRERCDREARPPAATGRREELSLKVLTRFDGDEREIFVNLIQEGFSALDRGHATKGMRMLERAAALAPLNAPLNAFLGEHFFRAGKMALARDYLARARAAEPENRRLCLWLAVACGDEGDAPRAKELLFETLRQGDNSYTAHYALGRLFAAEENWDAALVQFKQALAARRCPEAHYVVGLVYYQHGRHRMALRHLAKAVAMAPDYGEACYLLGLVYLHLGERARAGQAFDAARAADDQEPRYRAARKIMSRSGDVPPPQLFGVSRRVRKRLVTGGDVRLAAALQADALAAEGPR